MRFTATDIHRQWRPARTALMLLIASMIVGVGAACGVTGARTRDSSSANSSQSTIARRHPAPDRRWLGLNYNSGSGVGSVSQFAHDGIVWDREGGLEVGAGATPGAVSAFGHALHVSLGAGMVPDVLVDPTLGPRGCTQNPSGSDLCVPDTRAEVDRYVRGFVSTVVATDRAHPDNLIVFEPMDEPWDWASPPGSTPGRSAAAQYAAVLARLFPALRRAHAPLSHVYVPLTGELGDGTQWIDDLYRAQPCLAPGRNTCGPVEGWNAHVYGTPRSPTNSLNVVADLRDQMRSGTDNVIVSEMGFCATDVERGEQCDENTPEVDGTSATVSDWLGQTLRIGAGMHAAGWLRAIILWDRSGGGWSAQLPNAQLTALGRTLLHFAQNQVAR